MPTLEKKHATRFTHAECEWRCFTAVALICTRRHDLRSHIRHAYACCTAAAVVAAPLIPLLHAAHLGQHGGLENKRKGNKQNLQRGLRSRCQHAVAVATEVFFFHLNMKEGPSTATPPRALHFHACRAYMCIRTSNQNSKTVGICETFSKERAHNQISSSILTL